MEPRSTQDMVDFMAGKLVDLVGIPHNLPVRWNDSETQTPLVP